MQIRPVRSEAEHDAAVERIAQLMGAEPGSAASDELEVLVTLVDAYETKHFPIHQPDPVTILQFQMEQKGLTRKDLEPMIGSRARVSEIMTGKRALTLPMIRRLHALLGIPVDLLVNAGSAPIGSARRERRKYSVANPPIGRVAAIQQNAR